MQQIKYHTENLISFQIKGSLNNIFYDFLSKTGSFFNLFIITSRPNYHSSIPENAKIIYKDSPKYFELILRVHGNTIEKINTIAWAWKSYEHFCLILTKENIDFDFENALRNSASVKANIFNGFIIYRGIEDDVIWIQKPKDRDFLEIL